MAEQFAQHQTILHERQIYSAQDTRLYIRETVAHTHQKLYGVLRRAGHPDARINTEIIVRAWATYDDGNDPPTELEIARARGYREGYQAAQKAFR